MPWVRDFRASAVVVHTVGDGAASTVRSISNAGIQANSEVRKQLSSGTAFAEAVTLDGVAPVASFTTYDIAGALTALGLWKCFTSDGTRPGISLYSQKQGCAGAEAGSVHDQYLLKQGVAVARQFSVDHRNVAQISYDIYAAWDGSNAPVLRNANQALPGAALTPVGRWYMNSMTLNSVAVTGKRNITIDFGPTVTQEGADSDFYNSVVTISSLMPKVTVRGVDTSWFTTHGQLTGTTTSHANCSIDLRKRGISLAALEHCRFTAAGLITWDTIFSGSPESPSEASFNIDAAWDGTNYPVTAYANIALGA